MTQVHLRTLIVSAFIGISCIMAGAASPAAGPQSTPTKVAPSAPQDPQKPATQTQDDPAGSQVLFDSPEDAAMALVEAVRHRDFDMLRAVLGPDTDRLLSGDLNVDDEDCQRFAAAYDRKATLVDHENGTYTLAIGLQNWEFPAPIVGLNGKWWFDGEQGVDEILNRVIGQHELKAIDVCRRYPQVQAAYFQLDPDGDSVPSYATRILSTPGKRDGLYWPDVEGQPRSPLGSAVAEAYATGELHAGSTKPDPYYGYHYRILTSQGAGAPGGAMSYVDDSGRMTRGFAMIAWPASYGESGITTFIVSHHGKIYQRDLGEQTPDEVARIKAFDPAGWTEVGDDDMPVDTPLASGSESNK
jgi:hypothetical protein